MSKATVAIVTRQGHVLMVKAKESEGRAEWRFPGGWVELGESEAETASREVAEETGVFCTPMVKLGERIHPETKQLISYYVCEYFGGELSQKEPDKLDQVAWVPIAEVFELVSSPIFEPVREYLRKVE